MIIPMISSEKNYWLVRTNGGRYYNDFINKGIISINWDEITVEDIRSSEYDELFKKIKEHYPNKAKPGRAVAQLKTFVDVMKEGDYVVITSYASNKFYVGEIIDNEVFEEEIDSALVEENKKICPYVKRRRVKWLKETRKFDVNKDMFLLLQHAQNTINDANKYAHTIEGLVHDFYIMGDVAQLTINVKKEEDIPAKAFYSLGAELLELVEEFFELHEGYVNTEEFNRIITKVNINSRGSALFRGPKKYILVAGCLLVITLNGGGFSIPNPWNPEADIIELEMGSLIDKVSDFLNERQERGHRELIMKSNADKLEVETPEELKILLDAVDNSDGNGE